MSTRRALVTALRVQEKVKLSNHARGPADHRQDPGNRRAMWTFVRIRRTNARVVYI